MMEPTHLCAGQTLQIGRQILAEGRTSPRDSQLKDRQAQVRHSRLRNLELEAFEKAPAGDIRWSSAKKFGDAVQRDGKTQWTWGWQSEFGGSSHSGSHLRDVVHGQAN